MNIAIIGAGNVGKALASSAIRAGHTVRISGSGSASAAAAAAATGARPANTNQEAVAGADIVVLAVWYATADAVLAELGSALDGKVVIDTTNPVRPDLSGLLVEGASAAERLQAQAPNASIVKAFNTVFAARQADPFVDGTPVDALIAGTDEAAKAAVSEFAASLGFNPIDVGDLEQARALESFALLHMLIQVRTGGSWQGGWKLLEPRAA